MSRSLLKFVWLTPFVGVLVAAAPLVNGQESSPKRGQPILFSEPKSNVSASNSMQSATGESALNNFPEDAKKSFQTFKTENSMDGILLPPSSPVPPSKIQNKRIQELIERQKDWVFLSPEEMVGVPSAHDVLPVTEYDADGKEKEKEKPAQRFRERLDRSRVALTNKIQSDDVLGLDTLLGGHDAQTMPSFGKSSDIERHNTAKVARKLFDQSSDRALRSDQGGASGFGESFNFSQSPPVPERTKSQEEKMKQFEQLFGSSPASTSVADPLGLFPGQLPQTTVPDNFGAGSSSGLGSTFDQTGSTLSSSPQLPALPSVAGSAAAPSLTPQLPSGAQGAALTPPPPFAVPKRPF